MAAAAYDGRGRGAARGECVSMVGGGAAEALVAAIEQLPESDRPQVTAAAAGGGGGWGQVTGVGGGVDREDPPRVEGCVWGGW